MSDRLQASWLSTTRSECCCILALWPDHKQLVASADHLWFSFIRSHPWGWLDRLLKVLNCGDSVCNICFWSFDNGYIYNHVFGS